MKAILRGSEDNAIATFNASHRSIKDAIKRAAELEQALRSRASTTWSGRGRRLATAWPFLSQEADVATSCGPRPRRSKTCSRARPSIGSCRRSSSTPGRIEAEYDRRFDEALEARSRRVHQGFRSARQDSRLGRHRRRTAAATGGAVADGRARDQAKRADPAAPLERDACDGGCASPSRSFAASSTANAS